MQSGKVSIRNASEPSCRAAHVAVDEVFLDGRTKDGRLEGMKEMDEGRVAWTGSDLSYFITANSTRSSWSFIN